MNSKEDIMSKNIGYYLDINSQWTEEILSIVKQSLEAMKILKENYASSPEKYDNEISVKKDIFLEELEAICNERDLKIEKCNAQYRKIINEDKHSD
jgi:hypothetical protein